MYFSLYLKKYILLLFLERGWEGERETEKST